jgi:hypothetical protein
VWWISSNSRRRLAILPGPCWCLWLSNTQFIQLSSQRVQILLYHNKNHYNANYIFTKSLYTTQQGVLQWMFVIYNRSTLKINILIFLFRKLQGAVHTHTSNWRILHSE